jgi:pimeloyl-ACP methyl ester carboxylesterase
MNVIDIDKDFGRSRFLGTAAVTMAAAQLGMAAFARAQPGSSVSPTEPETPGSFGPLKQINAGLLNTGYAEVGPADGQAAILLHGWPYDIHSYVDVAPLLASAGYRVIVPYLRGYGTTRFLSRNTLRNGQQSVVALDVIALMDALKIKKAVLAGFDWGARTVDVIAALWPERCKAIVSVSGYLITSIKPKSKPLPLSDEYTWWYEYYFSVERGVLGYRENTSAFNKLVWQIGSPKWSFDDATYDRTAASFNNPDHVDIVIHNYRWRLSQAEGEPKYDPLEQKLFARPVIDVPTITMASEFDGPGADGKAYRHKFSGKYSHRILEGIGHNVPQEAPQAFAQAIVDVDS